MSEPRQIAPGTGTQDDPVLLETRNLLAAGGVIAFPTETFYALGADPRSEAALKRIIDLKGRPEGAPILLLLSGSDQVPLVAPAPPRAFETLAAAFWPGPLTIVVRALDSVSTIVTAGTGTVGLRVSGSRLPRTLARLLGWPVTGTSANLSGRPPARTPDELREALGPSYARIDLVVDAGAAPGGAPSTVIDLTSGKAVLVRAGGIPFEAVETALR